MPKKKKKTKKDWKVMIAAIASITILEGIALFKGHDGYLLTIAIAVIAGIAGYKFKK